jgi:hypothetical protein
MISKKQKSLQRNEPSKQACVVKTGEEDRQDHKSH